MIYLNYNNLDDETQKRLLSKSMKDVESEFGDDLEAYAIERGLNYQVLLNVEAAINLYNYEYSFNI